MEAKEKKNTGLSTGFLLGVIVGVIITLLLTTKRGKRILKMITDEGMSKLSNWEEIVADAVDDYTTKPAEPKLPPVDLSEERDEDDEQEAVQVEKVQEQELKKETKPLKRFFKGIHRSSIN